jgi:hypothetical protein
MASGWGALVVAVLGGVNFCGIALAVADGFGGAANVCGIFYAAGE